ncbi:hypothetical protein F383_28318 [Gossypium arboreum]|uniref:Uncharacterized protein n=1 Tax=Gossypium arboreum TaxID=29729 RepID=A0A0B0P9G5_GOSAR|nr:hypothetical protein F383_28318 [Gossypium arboreum]
MIKGKYMYFSDQLMICDRSMRIYAICAKELGIYEMYMNIKVCDSIWL